MRRRIQTKQLVELARAAKEKMHLDQLVYDQQEPKFRIKKKNLIVKLSFFQVLILDNASNFSQQ